jgi:hypothetical protein
MIDRSEVYNLVDIKKNEANLLVSLIALEVILITYAE